MRTSQPAAVKPAERAGLRPLTASEAYRVGWTSCSLCPCVPMGHLRSGDAVRTDTSTCLFYGLIGDCGPWWAQHDLPAWGYVEDTPRGRAASFWCYPCIAGAIYDYMQRNKHGRFIV